MNMNKEVYELSELEVIKFYTVDVITTSGEEDELPLVIETNP